MTDINIYLGRPGSLHAIPHPRGGARITRDRPTTVFRTGGGGARVGRTVGGKRQITFTWTNLDYDSFATLLAFDQGHEGTGPFVLLDPGQTNMLTVNQSGATSFTYDSTDFTIDPSVSLAYLSDNYTRTASGWGNATSGQTYTDSGGTVEANYFTNGSVGQHTMDGSANVGRFSLILTGVGDSHQRVKASLNQSPTGASIRSGLIGHYVDANNFDVAQLRWSVAGNAEVVISTVVGGSEVTQTNFNAGAYTPGEQWYLDALFDGTTISAKVWKVSGSEPSSYQATGTASGTSGRAGIRSIRSTGNTNTAPVTSYDDYTVSFVDTPSALSSDATTYRRGPRSLAWTHTATILAAPVLLLDSPSADWAAGLPVASGLQIVFSYYARGGGADAIVTLTPRLTWYDVNGASLSTSAGSPAATSGSAWTLMSVAATPPASAAYVQPSIEATSGLSAGSVLYFDELQLERGSAASEWRPGTGVVPVGILSLTEQWPWQASTYRSSPVLVLQETGA